VTRTWFTRVNLGGSVSSGTPFTSATHQHLSPFNPTHHSLHHCSTTSIFLITNQWPSASSRQLTYSLRQPDSSRSTSDSPHMAHARSFSVDSPSLVHFLSCIVIAQLCRHHYWYWYINSICPWSIKRHHIRWHWMTFNVICLP